MRFRWFAAAGLLLLIICVVMGWFAALFATSTPPTASSHAAVAVRADREPGSGGPGERAARADGARIAADDATNARRIEVLVVTMDGNPVAGATICYWPIRTPAERQRDDAVQEANQDPEVALTRTGMSRVTDARGVAWIEAANLDPEQGSQLIARHGERYGTGWVDATDQRLLLEVRRDVCFDIEVVDSLGRPRQGQIVDIRSECLSRRRGLDHQTMQTDATDANGMVRVAHAQLDLGLEQDVIAGRVVAYCERRTSDASSVRLAEQILDAGQIGSTVDLRLVLPAGGSIAVRVTDADGADAHADVWLRDEEGECFDREPADHTDGLCFQGLPLNRRWTVVADTGPDPFTVIPVIGPVTADEVVNVTIPMAARRWKFRGRLQRSDGPPVPNARVQWTCPELSTDCEFTAPVGAIRLAGTATASITEVTHMEVRVDSPLVAPKVFRFDRTYAPGIHDLGDLVLSPPTNERLLASLEIRCDGKPITEGAWTRLITGNRETNDEAEPPCVQRRAGDRIEILGVPPDRPVLLACRHDDCLGIRVPIAIGEHRIIDLQRAARLRLAVVPPEVPWDALAANLQCLDVAGDPVAASLDGEAQTFDWRWLVPGRYRLRIEAFGRVVHEEPELRLAPGSNDWPADRSRLDLRGRLRAFCIVARSAADVSKQLYVTAVVVPSGANLPANFDDRHHPDNTFVPSPTAADLLVRAPGFVPVRVHDPRSDVVLILQPLTRLEFPATGSGAMEIRVRVVADGVRDALLRAFDICNDHEPEQDTATTNRLAYAPGTELDVCVLHDGKPGPPQRVVVGTTSPQPIVLR